MDFSLAGQTDPLDERNRSDDSDAADLSESDEGSDLDDVAHVKATPEEMRDWETDEDRDIKCFRLLATYLRELPHMPSAPDDPAHISPWHAPDDIDMYTESPCQ